jgi:general secretion pathway protein C
VPVVSQRLVEPAKLLIIVGIAYTAASTGWYFVSPPTPSPLGEVRAGPARERPSVALDQLLAANLFGVADATQTNAPATFDAPATQLRLTLEGVFHAGVPELSAAIIAEQGRPGELFHVVQKLPGGVELVEVHADRVILRRGGLFETLRFPEESGLLAAGGGFDATSLPAMEPQVEQYVEEPVYEEPMIDAPVESSEDAPMLMRNDADTVRDTLEQYRSRLESDPAGTLSELGVTAVSGDSAGGYQLGNLANSPYLAQTGLQPGDVVLSVNGRPVGNIQQDRLEIANIMAQGSARLEVQRGERRFFVTASIK